MADEKRRLDTWLPAFVRWTLPRSESPESMLKWAGLFTLAAVMKRKVWWPKELMGGYEIFPNLYIVFVGEPAIVRKSTSTSYAQLLLRNLSGEAAVTFAGDVTSHSKLLEALSSSPDSSITIISAEFSSLIQTTPEAMYEILTDIFDNKTKFDWSTWAHGEKSIDKPSVNLIAATTPAWVSQQPPEYFVGGGFASRILFLYEDAPSQREIYYDHLDQKDLAKLGQDLEHDLMLIAGTKGEFRHDSKKTKEYIRAWYKAQPLLVDDGRLKGYYGRKHVHAHKIAGLLSLSERDDRVVTKAHWDEALKLLNYLESKMPQAFANLGMNPIALTMESILAYVKLKGSATLQQVAGRFYMDGLTLEQLKSALAFLCTTGKLRASGLANPVYHYEA
jgi:hypothetical protein